MPVLEKIGYTMSLMVIYNNKHAPDEALLFPFYEFVLLLSCNEKHR